jgi:hypothetical protein
VAPDGSGGTTEEDALDCVACHTLGNEDRERAWRHRPHTLALEEHLVNDAIDVPTNRVIKGEL